VRFSALALAPNGETMFVRALLDGSKVGLPADGFDVAFTAFDELGPTVARSFEWVFPSVSAGPHTLQMQWKTATGKTIYIFQQTLDVNYR
jgi:hypothetical protein